MGIYIPDIEMPKGHNYVTITIWSSGAASSVLFDREGVLREFKDFKELKAVPAPDHKKIKAVPVPPHGRLGDLDRLALEMMDAKNADQALAMVDDAPTIIEADEEGE